jgi:hypothetical protein
MPAVLTVPLVNKVQFVAVAIAEEVRHSLMPA